MTFELPNAVAAMNDAVAAARDDEVFAAVARLAGLAAAIDDIAGAVKAGRKRLGPDWEDAAVEEVEKTLDDYAAAVKAAAAGLETALGATDQPKSDVDELLGQAMENLRQLAESKPFASLSAPAVTIEDAGRTLSVTGFDSDGHVKVTVKDGKTYDLDFNAASSMGRPPSDSRPSDGDVEHVPAGTNGKCVIEDGPLTITAERSLFDEAVVILTVDGGVDKPTTHTLDFAADPGGTKDIAFPAAMPARPRPATRAEPDASPSPPTESAAAAESEAPSSAAEPAASPSSVPSEPDESADSSVPESAEDSSPVAADRDVSPSPVVESDVSSGSSGASSGSVAAEGDVSPSAVSSSSLAVESAVASGSVGAESSAASGSAESDVSSGLSVAESGVASGSVGAELPGSAGSSTAESGVASGVVPVEREATPSPAAASSSSAVDSDLATSSVEDASPGPATETPSRSEASSPTTGELAPETTNPQGDPSGTLSGVLAPEQPADATGSALPMMAGAGAGAGVAAGVGTGIGWSVHGDLFDSGDPVYSVHGVLGEDDLKSQ